MQGIEVQCYLQQSLYTSLHWFRKKKKNKEKDAQEVSSLYVLSAFFFGLVLLNMEIEIAAS